jgi:hypothetical protein
MPYISFIGSPGGSLGSVQAGGGSSSISVGLSQLQHPFLQVTAGGTELPHALSATITYGLDITVAQASVELTENPGIANDTEVQIVCGAGTNNIRRFRGRYKERESVMWPHLFTMSLEGMLGNAARHQQARGIELPSFINQKLPITGVPLSELLHGDIPSDENIVRAVLSYVPGLDVDPSDIGGTGKLFGRLSWRDMAWRPTVTALGYISELDKVCLGYRLFENPVRIMRTQVFGYPSNTADTSFTEGIDIWDATGRRSIRELKNAAYIEGYPIGGVPGLIFAYGAEDNDFQTADQPFVESFSSPLIEGPTGDENYLTAEDVLAWKLTEMNRELVGVDLITIRDDLLFCGRSIAVNVPHSDVTEPVWMQQVTVHVSAIPPATFTQRIIGKGGGIPGSYTPPPAG